MADNLAFSEGGGVYNQGSFTATNSTISRNRSLGDGAGIYNEGMLELTQVTISRNGQFFADMGGGGIYNVGDAVISNSTITINTGLFGGLGNDAMGTVILTSTIIAGNFFIGFVAPRSPSPDVVGAIDPSSSFNLIGNGSSLTGIMNGVNNNIIGTASNPIDPRLRPISDNGGPTLTHALLPDSPALNAGDNPLDLDFDQRGTPFVREFGSGIDPNQTDIGAFELQSANDGGNAIVATAPRGPGAPGVVTVINAITQEELFTFEPYPDSRAAFAVAVGDVNGDMTPDIITAAGPGGGPHIKVIDGQTQAELYSFFAFDPAFGGGAYVASADLNGDDRAEIIVGADGGGGPRIQVYSGADGTELLSFFGFDSSFSGGVRLAAGDVSGDGTPDIIVAAGPGGGPHVRIFNGQSGDQITGPLGSFYAFEDSSFGGGLFIAAGDVNGDGRIDVITSAGSGGGPRIRIFDSMTGDQLAGPVGSFFAYAPGYTGGVRVAASDITGDGRADIITTPGPTGGPHLRAFDAASTGMAPQEIRSVFVEDPTFTGGIFVAASTELESPVSTLQLAEDFAPIEEANSLVLSEVEPIFDAAPARLEEAGLPSNIADRLSALTIAIADLPSDRLGEALPGRIVLDVTAAGQGWFIDATPLADEEFAGEPLTAIDPDSLGRIDLLTVLLHELAHHLGADDLDIAEHPGELLAETLPPGNRRLPTSEDFDLLFANDSLLESVLL